MGRSLQRDLNRIAEVADTSSSEGLNYVLTGIAFQFFLSLQFNTPPPLFLFFFNEGTFLCLIIGLLGGMAFFFFVNPRLYHAKHKLVNCKEHVCV